MHYQLCVSPKNLMELMHCKTCVRRACLQQNNARWFITIYKSLNKNKTDACNDPLFSNENKDENSKTSLRYDVRHLNTLRQLARAQCPLKWVVPCGIFCPERMDHAKTHNKGNLDAWTHTCGDHRLCQWGINRPWGEYKWTFYVEIHFINDFDSDIYL